MLYTKNLEELIFGRHEMHETDELIVLSGYLGPKPVSRLESLPFPVKVIYGMYGSDGIQKNLHNSLKSLQTNVDNVNIFYSKLPVHSKCYIWKRNNRIIHALIGSANFSVNGLTTPFREVLAETTVDSFDSLEEYIGHVINNSISCLETEISIMSRRRTNVDVVDITEVGECLLTLLDPSTSETQIAHGLNWGQGVGNHTNIDDACIPIRTNHIRNYPELFPPKQLTPTNTDGQGRSRRHNDSIEIIWDDGKVMRGLLEGSQPVNGVIYPKQISSFPSKNELGLYIKDRIGVPHGQPIRKHHLERYGRTDIKIELISEGIYSFDFSV